MRDKEKGQMITYSRSTRQREKLAFC